MTTEQHNQNLDITPGEPTSGGIKWLLNVKVQTCHSVGGEVTSPIAQLSYHHHLDNQKTQIAKGIAAEIWRK